MNVLVVEPYKEPYEKDIEPGLESLQHEVGGDIECVYPFDDPVGIICNDEGKLEGLPLNRSLRDEDGEIYDVVAGTFLVVGLGEESFEGLVTGICSTAFRYRYYTIINEIWLYRALLTIVHFDEPDF